MKTNYPTNPSSIRLRRNYGARKLGEVCEINMGQSPVSSTYNENKDGLPFYQGKKDYGEKYPTPRVWCSEPIKIVETGDILISVRAPVGALNIAKEKSCIGRGLAGLRGKANLDQDYLFHFLKLKEKEIADLGTGSTFTAISKKHLENIEIPLPPLSEQKKIVAKLERVLGKISEAKKLRAETRENTDSLLPAELYKIFSQQDSYSLIRANQRIVKKWEEKELGEICEKTSNMKWDEHKSESFRYIDLTSVSREVFSVTETKEVNSKNAPSRAKKIVKTCDVIFGTTRPTLMRVTVIPPEYDNHICSTGFAVLRARKDRILPQFIYYFIRSERFMDRMENIQTGASYPAVSDTKVLETKIPLPPLAEQKKIIARLDSLSEKIASLRQAQAKTQNDFTALEQSVLSKAFSG